MAALSGGKAVAQDWYQVSGPSGGPAAVIGSAAAGCLAGGVALPQGGEGYQVLRPSRNRFWGHPDTIRFVRNLAQAAQAGGISPFLVGDMAQPRGGPMAFGHGSHQNGLDVDIWFRLPKNPLRRDEIEAPVPISMVQGTGTDSRTWTADHIRLLELAARAPGVDRIFVNPAIKQSLCRALPPDKREWLAKLRPWWGHDEHFHVRLACPADSPLCEVQRAVPDGDGCGAEVESWLAKPTLPAPPSKPHRQTRALPAACGTVLD